MANNASEIAMQFDRLVRLHGELNRQMVELRGREAKGKETLAGARRALRNIEVSILANLVVDAKNAEGRKLQQEAALDQDQRYQGQLTAIEGIELENAKTDAAIDACHRELRSTELQMQMDIAKLTNLNTPRFHREI